MASDGKFGLWYNRPSEGQPIRIAGSKETDEKFHHRQRTTEEKNAANRRLNHLSKEIREEIDTRLWATMYLKYLIKRIHTTATANIEFKDLPNIGKLSLKDETPTTTSPERENQAQTQNSVLELHLERRLKDARIGADAIWATLDELINQLTSEIRECPPDSCIGFRLFDYQSQARLFHTGDIRCGNWQEFNVDQELTRRGTEEHITHLRVPTDYISISTSPRRLWNLVDKGNIRKQELAVIDLRVLQRLGIAYGSTTDDLGFSNIGMNKTKYATKHHVLVVGWIPRRSVLGFYSKETFEVLLEEANIDTSTETRDTPAIEYDRRIPFKLISKRLNITAEMIRNGAK